jgi:hypothetical protein
MPQQVTREGAPSRVLFLASNPTEMKFGFVEELHRIEEARRSRPGAFDVIPRWSVSLAGLKRHVTADRPTVVHVLSPTVDPARNELVLSDESGEPEYVPSAAFAKAFAGAGGRATRLDGRGERAAEGGRGSLAAGGARSRVTARRAERPWE